MSHGSVQLGLGLIGIGKPWGHAPAPVPSESEAIALLESAFDLGIRYFDTAPSYGDGVSEERLGRFLKRMPAGQRSQVTVATKFGEHWDRAAGAPYADHSFDALRRSLDESLARLGADRDSATAQDHAAGAGQRARWRGRGSTPNRSESGAWGPA